MPDTIRETPPAASHGSGAAPENTAGIQRGKSFRPGKSGNPDGRPRGSRNATTLALETLLDGQATALTQKAIELALTGDIAAKLKGQHLGGHG